MQLLDVARQLAQRIDHPHALGMVEAFAAVLEFSIGDWRAARRHCDRARTILRDRCLGVVWELDTIEFIRLWTGFYEGELAELARRVPPLLRDAAERGDRYVATNLCTSFVPLRADARMSACSCTRRPRAGVWATCSPAMTASNGSPLPARG